MAKIVVDTPTKEGLGFKDYAEALVNIILDSESPFTIGILGKWGVGKTSLMQTMFEKLEAKRNGVIPVWFNAWRSERERNLAIIPLLEALMGEIKDRDLRRTITNILKSIKLKFGPFELELGKVGSQNQVEGDLYYDNLKAIETTLEDSKKKIVVFIDDLDRCAPNKILEVLESTKVFLDIKGFVYVLGLNDDVAVKAIDQKYKDLGVNGRDYLEKILQIPFRIPDWNVHERGKCIEDLIKNDKIDSAYKETFETYKDIIKEVIERTPRQVKQFINTYICEQEVFKDKNLDQTTHLILTILKFKYEWYDFYQNLFNVGYRKKLKEILNDGNKLEEELKLKKDLIKFINGESDTINKIVEMEDGKLSEYRRAGMIIHRKIIKPESSREELIGLLRSGNVSEFNALRNREGKGVIDLGGANLRDADLSGAKLNGANLSWAHLSGANLSGANLSGGIMNRAELNGANLSGANLRDADLSGAKLNGAKLSEADLSGADLSEADLRNAKLIGTVLSRTVLNKAILSQGVILVKEPNYQETQVAAANFQRALISDRGFLKYLNKKGAENVPSRITSKDRIKKLLKDSGYESSVIAQIIKRFFEE